MLPVRFRRSSSVLLAAGLSTTAAVLVAAATVAPDVLGRLAERGEIVLGGLRLTSARLHLAGWTAGTVLGGIAAVLVLRRRQALSAATLAGAALFIVTLALGARLQYRLEAFPVTGTLWGSETPLVGGSGRLPLGQLLGAVVALGFCRLVGAPWRAMGDAVAVWASVQSAIGRLGCLFAGCCMGRVCADGEWGFCLVYPRGTPPYLNQVAARVLDPTSAVSHPVHVLPLYFALTALAILAVLLWLLRRGARPGALLVTFGLLEPITKVGLESLRVIPRHGSLMLIVPLTTFVGALLLAARQAAVEPSANA